AEDGIRGFHVTGVQTCALPIFGPPLTSQPVISTLLCSVHLVDIFFFGRLNNLFPAKLSRLNILIPMTENNFNLSRVYENNHPEEMGRASCRESLQRSGVADRSG